MRLTLFDICSLYISENIPGTLDEDFTYRNVPEGYEDGIALWRREL